MRCVVEPDLHVFAEHVLPFLAQRPVENSVLLTNIEVRAYRGVADSARPRGFWIEDEAGNLAGVGFQTPRGLLLSAMTPHTAVRFAHELSNAEEFSRVSGPLPAIQNFVEEWTQSTGIPHQIAVNLRIYQLNRLSFPTDVPGKLRHITADDRPLLIDWNHAFHRDTRPAGPSANAAAELDRRLALGAMFLWEDNGQPVSMAGYAGPSVGIARIGPVYTPPEHRRRGYGAAITAAASQQALEQGAEHVMLYADLSNSTSNSIYQQVGFQPLIDARDYVLDAIARQPAKQAP